MAASSGVGTADPDGRGVQLLGAREAILLDQAARAGQAARTRALALYRLLRFAAVERGAGAADAQARLGGRAVALGTAVLERDLAEARLLRAELDRVREERGTLTRALSFDDRHADVGHGSPQPSFLRPVTGGVVLPFGVGRDAATGAWIFRAAARFAARPGEPVRSPADGRIVRVGASIAGGVALVLAHDQDRWTTVISGLGVVRAAAGDAVHRGDVLGRAGIAPVAGSAPTVRIETWRGRSPVDPASVLRAP